MMHALAAAQYGLAPALASALLHSLWQNALLAAAAALALGAMTRASAAWRHSVAMAFLVAMVLVPAVQFLLCWQQPGAPINDGLLPVMMMPGLGVAATIFDRGSAPVAAVLVLFWLSGVGLMLVRHVGGLRAIAAMERAPHSLLPPPWRHRVDELRRALGIARAVAVRLSDDVLTPCAARFLRPVIWLPLSLLTRAPAEQLEALMAHELAHIARKDWLWNRVQCAIESLLFFHPAVWWLGRRIRQEREHACDDLAVAACGDAIALTEALAALACQRPSSPHVVLAAHRGSLKQRVARLLSGPPAHQRWRGLAVLGTLMVLGVLFIAQVAVLGSDSPDLLVRASTEGMLGPGDFREITANGRDHRRYYRVSIDAQGRATEVYQVDGQVRPIDADVRAWVSDVMRPSVPPTLQPVDAQ
jgi:beta-lactamase regulating signal transducer with metallopeptidase domain